MILYDGWMEVSSSEGTLVRLVPIASIASSECKVLRWVFSALFFVMMKVMKTVTPSGCIKDPFELHYFSSSGL